MNLKLQNILKIESADIRLGGLTVITGENDTGKSTVGKILFTILKAVNNIRQIDEIYSDLTALAGTSSDLHKLCNKLSKDIMSGISSIETRYWECRDFDSNIAKL